MSTETLALMSRAELEEHCRSRARAVYVGRSTLLCRVLGKFVSYVDSEDRGISPHLAMDGFWEAWVTLALSRLVQPGWSVVEVGANHGYYTLLLADLVGPSGHLTAFEPNPRLFDLLTRNVTANGFQNRTTLFPYAAGMSRGEVELCFSRKSSGDGSVVLRRSGDLTRCAVSQYRLDELTHGPIQFLKIDAEGADYDVLAGADALLNGASPPMVMLEHYAPFHDRASDRLESVVATGFALSFINADGDIEATRVGAIRDEPLRCWDLLLTPSPSADPSSKTADVCDESHAVSADVERTCTDLDQLPPSRRAAAHL